MTILSCGEQVFFNVPTHQKIQFAEKPKKNLRKRNSNGDALHEW